MQRIGIVLLTVACLLGVAGASEASTGKVALFSDPAFVDFSVGGEGPNITAALTGLGYTVAPFSGTSAAQWAAVLDTSDVLVVAELEIADLSAAMSEDAKAVIASYVCRGKPMIMIADNRSHMGPFLNTVFGYAVVQGATVSSGNATQAAGAAGTPFAAAPASVAMLSATTSITAASLPPGTTNFYMNGADPVVFSTRVGAGGRLVYVGYDWFSPSVDWDNLLDLSIQHGLAGSATSFKVAMFADPAIVDMTPGQEGLQMKAALEAMGHEVTTFTGSSDVAWTAAMAAADVLVVPEQEPGNLVAFLPAATISAIRKYVLGGGGLLVNDSGTQSTSFLNLLFGYSLTTASSAASYALNLGAATGTPFAAGPATLPSADATRPMTALPGGALALYTNGASTAVWVVDRGLGHVGYLGFDWFAPSSNEVYTPWLPALNCALAYAAAPVVVTPDASAQPPGTNAPVTVNLNAAKFITPPTTLRFRAGGDPTFGSVAMTGPVTALTANIPGAALTNKGVQYYIEITDGIGVGTIPRNAPRITANLPVTLTNQSLFSLPASGYQLAGVPIAASNPDPLAIFNELGGYDVTKWRYGTFDGTAYHEPGAGAANATPGQGFWIISKGAAGIAASGTSTDVSGPILVTLKPGFNQIADPFEFPVDFADVVLPLNVQNNLIGFDGSSYTPGQTTLSPGKGYWIKNDNTGDVVIAIPPLGAGVTPPVPHAALTATDGWSLQVNGHAGRFADVGNVLGMKSGALDGHDAFDLSDPPVPPGGWVRLGFAAAGEGDLLADWRPRTSTGATWDVLFASDQAGEPFHIDLLPAVSLPEGWGIAAFDGSREIDLGPTGSISGVVGESPVPHTYRVSVGSAEYLAGIRAQALSTVTAFALAAPFPNPTRGRLAVDLALPRAEHDVQVDVFDANGRLVRNVASGPFAAGVHRFEWDGRMTSGDRAGAGLYFVRARAGAQSASRKVALIP